MTGDGGYNISGRKYAVQFTWCIRTDMEKSHRIIVGSVVSGCFSTVIGHPLDTIKVHQQTNLVFSKKGIIDTTRLLARGNALRLFRGIGAPMANQIMMNSVMFSVFDNVKDSASQSEFLNANEASFIAGMFSGFATAFISTPMDWIKIQAQISLSQVRRSEQSTYSRYAVLPLLKRYLLRDGRLDIPYFVKTLYSGHMANLAREGIFTAIYLGMYENITNAVKGNRKDSNKFPGQDWPLGMGTILFISSFTGACAWLCNLPFDTIKTVMQAGERITMKDAIRSIYNSGGWRSFWRGARSSTLRAMLVTSSRMLSYEMTLELLR